MNLNTHLEIMAGGPGSGRKPEGLPNKIREAGEIKKCPNCSAPATHYVVGLKDGKEPFYSAGCKDHCEATELANKSVFQRELTDPDSTDQRSTGRREFNKQFNREARDKAIQQIKESK